MAGKSSPKVPYRLSSEKANRAVQELISSAGAIASQDADLLAQMVTTILKLQDEQVDRGDLKILNTTLKELRWAFRVFRPYRSVRKVSIFGSARTQPRQPSFQAAREFGRLMRESGWMVITGGSSGIMHAGNEGAGRAYSFGANIKLPTFQDPNPVVQNDKKLINFKYFFTRKLIFVKESDAICLFPGGLGTLDEAFEVLTLVQTGKMMPRPIVMVEPKSSRYWRSWLAFVKGSLLRLGMIDREDVQLFQLVSSAQEARDTIVNFYRNYHSMRFVGDHLVIRLKKPLSTRELKELNRGFKDILRRGAIEPSGPLAAEAGEPGLAGLPRLVLNFNLRSFGRLKQMCDAINQMGG